MKLKQIVAPAIIASVAFGTFASASAAGSERGSQKEAPQKVDMCHVSNDGAAKLINVSSNAAYGHARHGDNVPGGEISGQEGFIYGDDCAPVPAGLAPGCYDSSFFFDLKFNGKKSAGNIHFLTSIDGSCSGTASPPLTLVQEDSQDRAVASCGANGVPARAALNLTILAFENVPDTAWICQ